MNAPSRDDVIEEIAREIENMRLRGQKRPWWSVWWTVTSEPMPHRDEIARLVRTMKRGQSTGRAT